MGEHIPPEPARQEASQQRLVLLTGMHRSGTSFLARRLHDGGLAFPGELLAPADDNPEGYWEARSLVRLNNQMMKAAGIDWKSCAPVSASSLDDLRRQFARQAGEVLSELKAEAGGADFAIKDPRLCRLLPVWAEAARGQGLTILLGATLRPAGEVARSLYHRRRDPRFRPAAIEDPPEAVLLWLRYLLDLEYHSRGMNRRFVDFDAIGAISSPDDLLAAGGGAGGIAPPACLPASWQAIADSLTCFLPQDGAHQGYLDLARTALDEASITAGPAAPARTYVTAPASAQRSGPLIAFVSGEPESRGHIYRVENRITALTGSGAASFRAVPERDLPDEIAAFSDMIVIFRRQMDRWQDRLCRAASARGVPVIFDVDDLIFDPELMVPDVFRYLEGRPAPELDDWVRRARGYQAAVEAASQCWVTTHPLAEEIGRFNRNVRVLRNGLSEHHLRQAARLQVKPKTEDIVVGYASGTATHDRDFAEVAGALAHIMSKADNVTLEVIGPLGDAALGPLSAFSSRVVRRPKVDYFRLSEELTRFDINLAPLERGNRFCACKSELKFFEAGIVGVATIASQTPPFAQAIASPQYGTLADRQEDWEAALEALVCEPGQMARLGEAARKRADRIFGPAQQRRDLLARLAEHFPAFGPPSEAVHPVSDSAGFSLVEVLVGLAIMAAIAILIFSSLLSQVQQADIIRSSTRQAFETVAARRLVETVVSSTIPAWSEDQEGAFRGQADTMSGTGAFSLFGPVARLQSYSLRLRQAGQDGQLLDIVTEEGSWTLQGIPPAASFRYLGWDGVWHTSWPLEMPRDADLDELETWFANQGLPRMVTVWDEAEGAPGGHEIALANTDILSTRLRDLTGELP